MRVNSAREEPAFSLNFSTKIRSASCGDVSTVLCIEGMNESTEGRADEREEKQQNNKLCLKR